MTEVKRYREFTGTSSTGSRHGLRVEEGLAGFRFAVTGVNGKRHAAVQLSAKDVEALVDWITAGPR
jgi:hypothetical protein